MSPSTTRDELAGGTQQAAAKDEHRAKEDQPEGTVNVTLPAGTQSQYVLVWLTKLPKVSDGYQGTISEVTIQK